MESISGGVGLGKERLSLELRSGEGVGLRKDGSRCRKEQVRVSKEAEPKEQGGD